MTDQPDDTPFITLAQLVKMLEMAPTGGQAKAFVRAGGILVNGEAEARPGRKLRQGDVVTIAGEEYEVDLVAEEDEDVDGEEAEDDGIDDDLEDDDEDEDDDDEEDEDEDDEDDDGK